jgi:PIN domain nuclease of toxin-antitoxin system
VAWWARRGAQDRAAHAAAVAGLPDHHGDPFDRLLVAQALAEPLRLVTADAFLARYTELVTVV